jgi:hypothetical protein
MFHFLHDLAKDGVVNYTTATKSMKADSLTLRAVCMCSQQQEIN